MPTNKNTPKVSIIIPVYNGANYLKEAIDSALAQTYSNIEIIVVNDGSKDDGATEAVAQSYGKKIRYFAKENGGVATALNLALQKMKGEYFSWLSHDDLYEPCKVEAQIDYLVANNLIGSKVILYTDFYIIDKKSNIIAKRVKDHHLLGRKPAYALIQGHVGGITLLIPKAAFKECGNFDKSLQCAQDYDLWARMFKKYRPVHLPLLLASTRYHTTRMTNTSPVMVSEVNALYINLINNLSKKERMQLEGSDYNFYYEMAALLKPTPYSDARNYCLEKLREITANNHWDEKPLVSIILPVQEPRDDLLTNTLKSIRQQDYSNIEVLIIGNKGLSQNKSVKQALKSDKRISLICDNTSSNLGQLINTGIKKSHGEYVAFIDQYYSFAPNKLSVQIKHIGLTQSKLSHTSYLDSTTKSNTTIFNGTLVGNISRPAMFSHRVNLCTVLIHKDLLRGGFRLDNFNCSSSVLPLLDLLKLSYMDGVNQPLTIKQAEDPSGSAAAKIQELQTLIRYLLTDPYYSSYPLELSWVMAEYSEAVKDFYPIEDKSVGEFKGNKITRNVRKTQYYLVHEGVKSVAKRAVQKVKRRVQAKEENSL